MTPPIAADPAVDLGSDRLGTSGDAVYAAIVAAHDGLDAAASAALDARLVLLLANLVGAPAAVLAAVARARAGLGAAPPD